MKHLLLLIFVLPSTAFSQLKVSSTLLNANTKIPVQNANVFLDEYGVGVATNSKGGFELVLPKRSELSDSIFISCIGYQTIAVSVGQLQQVDSIFIKEKTVELGELVVLNQSFSAKDILRIAMGKMSKNHRSKPYQLHMFYRHYCSEKDVYGRLIEAAVTIYDPKGHKQLFMNPESKIEVEVSQIRRSFDYTKNFDEHDAISVYSTLKYDVSSYETMFHSYPDEWGFAVVDTTFYNGSYVWVVGYSYNFMKNKGAAVFKVEATGKVYVNISDFAVVRVEETQTNEMNKEFENHSYLLEWEVNYIKYLDDYYLSYIKESGWNIDEKLGNNKEIVSKKDHRFHVEMMVNAIVLNGFTKFKGKEPDQEAIEQLKYDSDFWSRYSVLKNTPLEDKIISDLEKEKSLQQQYED